jgi:hypothetical protein
MRFVFSVLHKIGWHYVEIFMITAVLYVFGVVIYFLLVKVYIHREKAGVIESDDN